MATVIRMMSAASNPKSITVNLIDFFR